MKLCTATVLSPAGRGPLTRPAAITITTVITVLQILAPPILAQPFDLDGQVPEKVRQVRELRREISLLNLLNGLHLSEAQLEQLIPLAEQAAATRERYQLGLAGQADGYLQVLTEVRDTVATGTLLSEEQRQQALRWERREEMEPRDRAAAELGRLEDRARQVLSDAQVAIIERFKPCLIPPQDLADPVAVGQASTNERQEVVLGVIRRMPEYLYAERRQAIAEAVVAWGEREKGRLPDDVRAATVATYLDKLDHLRGLSAVDFELQRAELASSFELFDDEVTYHNGHTRELGRISHLLLNRLSAEVLQRWRDSGRDSGAVPATAAEPAVIGTDPNARRRQRQQQGIARYRKIVERMLRERLRMGAMSRFQGQRTARAIGDTGSLATAEEQLTALAGIADDLNRLALTRTSVHALYGHVVGLSRLKQVPGVVKHHDGPSRPVPDLTGLGQQVSEARRLAEGGDLEGACATLHRVVACLEDFSAA